jgi:hypothetical protein
MNKEETEKFNQVISDTYNELLTKRAKKPLHHAIYHMLSTLPEELRFKDAVVKEFYDQYVDKYLKDVREI